MLAARMRHAKADQVMVFVYTDEEPCEGRLPRGDLVAQIEVAMPMPVRDAVLVTDERVWSYLCDDPRCCPPEGRPRTTATPGSLALAAAHALNGRAVLPDRNAVVASVQPVDGAERAAMEQAIDEAAAAHAAMDARQARTKARRLATKLRARYDSAHGYLTDAEAAVLVVSLHDIRLRDTLLGWATPDADGIRWLFRDLARRALPPLDAPACTLHAWASYMHGDGLVASIALERALESEPAYNMARLLNEALERQVPPSALWSASAGF
jgi:hypothetical protein